MFGDWSLDPLFVVTVLAGALYLAGVRRLAARGRHWPIARSVAFAGGLVVIVFATQSGLAQYDRVLFSLHVVQHLLLGMVAPLLLVLGAPVTLALQASHRSAQTAWAPSSCTADRSRSSPIRSSSGSCSAARSSSSTSPVSTSSRCATAGCTALVHVHFVVVGCLFMAYVIGVDPLPRAFGYGARLLFVAVVLPFHAFLGVALLGRRTVIAADWYAEVSRPWVSGALSDQKLGAGMLWAFGELFGLLALGIVLYQWMRHEEIVAVRARPPARRGGPRLDATTAPFRAERPLRGVRSATELVQQPGGNMDVRLRRVGALVVTTGIILAALVVAPAGAHNSPPPGSRDRARYILPPGNYGGLPTTANSLDQLPLYDALTPKRGNVTDADIDALYLPEDFKPIGTTREEVTPRTGTKILYDEYGVPHVYGKTRADLAYGAGWVTARDRSLLLTLGRGPARAAVADVPGINAFGLVTSGQSFVPSAATEQLLTDQMVGIITTYGDKGWQIIQDLMATADGITAYNAANGINLPPATVNDLIAVTAFIGSIFGAGGGAEASNAAFLSKLQNRLGPETGRAAWEDAMLFGDPEAPTTISRPFSYGPLTGGAVTGSATIDEDSIVSFDPREGPTPAAGAPSAVEAATVAPSGDEPTFPAAGPVPAKQASNFLVVDPTRSASRKTLAVMGPQLGYYYPEIVQQIHLSGPGVEAQGIAVPGAAMYILIGRTPDYAWSLTSANHDVRDVFAEQLCNPDGSPPTRQSDHYVFEGACRPFEMFDAGTLNGAPIVYPRSVHGPLIGTATSDGQPVALTRQRSTYGRDGLNLAALKDMTEGQASTPERFWRAADQFGFTFNWAYASRQATAFYTSGRLPERAPGLDRRLPTIGTGAYEWQGFLDGWEHPHSKAGPEGLLLNWNNQAAPGFMHGDDTPFGSVHRVELFDQFPSRPTLADDVSVMNRAATEDVRSEVWPVVSQVLRGGAAPNQLSAQVVDLLDEWVQRRRAGARRGQQRPERRRRADGHGRALDPGGRSGDASGVRGSDRRPQQHPGPGWPRGGVVRRQGPANAPRRPGLGQVQLALLRQWIARGVPGVAVGRRRPGRGRARGGPWARPAVWRSNARRTGFIPGIIPDTIRATNRPTFQQVLELAPVRGEKPHHPGWGHHRPRRDHDDDHHRDHRRYHHHRH